MEMGGENYATSKLPRESKGQCMCKGSAVQEPRTMPATGILNNSLGGTIGGTSSGRMASSVTRCSQTPFALLLAALPTSGSRQSSVGEKESAMAGRKVTKSLTLPCLSYQGHVMRDKLAGETATHPSAESSEVWAGRGSGCRNAKTVDGANSKSCEKYVCVVRRDGVGQLRWVWHRRGRTLPNVSASRRQMCVAATEN